MSDWLKVNLSAQTAAAQWGPNALLSFNEGSATVHATERRRIQQAGRRLRSQGLTQVELGEGFGQEQQWAFAEGFMSALGGEQIRWAGDSAELEARFKVARWVRDITNKGPEQQSPQMLASEAASFITALGGEKVSYKMISGEALKDAGWTGLYNVGRGSERPPVMLVLDYNPGTEDTPVAAALVGKGITFDSGGYSIKASEGMLYMKADMGGAAMVAGGLALSILRGLQKRVRLILCCAENLVSGNAYKLGDVLTYKNGTTVEIVNTDAEGRLVLADGLLVASESGAPLIIDAATLTGAAVTAVGSSYNALFALDREMAAKVNAIANAEDEPAWPLPLEPFHQFECPSAYADTANSRPVKGGGAGGASNAAGFLSRFVRDQGQGWVHLDLAACFNNNENGLWSAGATARGIRTIARSLLDLT
ncbi:aminopeptidase B [Gallaecimonas xiamenensis 3-C-1]|uniref:Aminopeptidase B n=2 Tax=Gallaecimonas TaxID=745410 RepID=K2JGK8_9GAMM|nr:aminopeptidase B [Gallaecimonas xiamenensis 3-C-1]